MTGGPFHAFATAVSKGAGTPYSFTIACGVTSAPTGRFVGAEELTGQELHQLRKVITERMQRDEQALAESTSG
ncbi:hypothetical protein PRN20_20175 [Devosia sp. ZB163]|uniref:hypothetical protein n=1 Tax=Devosia sp. ZB163 TaxID=3025938 RepID=UPI002361C546|nr:hypothetical protein [Devosia sp. ZB163]MDC9826060.1 hypothetical protein [Devosia sp. ZB163]